MLTLRRFTIFGLPPLGFKFAECARSLGITKASARQYYPQSSKRDEENRCTESHAFPGIIYLSDCDAAGTALPAARFDDPAKPDSRVMFRAVLMWTRPLRKRQLAQRWHLPARGAKILRWECDTPLAREMATYPEASDFLCFCLERAEEFSKRDWLASLTLLTVRKRFSTSLPQFQEYSQVLISKAEVHFQDSVHLLLHRYGVLGYAPAVWRLLPLMVARVPLMTPKQIALCAWGLGQLFWNQH